ncbi:MAG: DUF4411 family protein [Acidobacteriota bacterium]|nr:DUF4411 family protein [Acidobacteriota bacterium]
MPGPIWVFDTSGIIEINGVPRADRPALLAKLTELVKEGRLRMPRQVVEELKRGSDELVEWAKMAEAEASLGSASLDEVRAVLAVVPDVLDPQKDSGADEADPYVLAMAIKLKTTETDVRIVTQETKDRSGKTSLRTAAGILNLVTLPFLGFRRVEGF